MQLICCTKLNLNNRNTAINILIMYTSRVRDILNFLTPVTLLTQIVTQMTPYYNQTYLIVTEYTDIVATTYIGVTTNLPFSYSINPTVIELTILLYCNYWPYSDPTEI